MCYFVHSFNMSPRDFLRIHTDGVPNKNPTYGSIIITLVIVLVAMCLLMAPKAVQPFATYIAIICLTLLPLTFLILKISYNYRESSKVRDMPSMLIVSGNDMHKCNADNASQVRGEQCVSVINDLQMQRV